MFAAFQKDGYEPLLAEKVNSLDTLILLVQLNRGVSYLPKSLVAPLDKKLSWLEVPDTNHAFSIEMTWNCNSKNEYLQAFIAVAKEINA